MPEARGTGLGKVVWSAKARLARLPGLYRAYKWATTRLGEGRVYRIRIGPMKGLRWRRYNALPYWYHVGMYEPHVSQLLAAHLRPGDTFWDVGANAGYHTLMAARVVGPRGTVVSFEPDPVTCAMLREEIAANDFANCQVVEAAVSDSNGRIVLMRKPNNLQSALAGVASEGEPVEVQCVTLDAVAGTLPTPDVIKMDIEGAEILALPGAERILGGPRRPRLLLSVHGSEAAEFCRGFLLRHGYYFAEERGFEQMWVAVPAERG